MGPIWYGFRYGLGFWFAMGLIIVFGKLALLLVLPHIPQVLWSFIL